MKPTTEDQSRTADGSRGDRVIQAMRAAPKPKRGMSTDQLMDFTRGEPDAPADPPVMSRPGRAL